MKWGSSGTGSSELPGCGSTGGGAFCGRGSPHVSICLQERWKVMMSRQQLEEQTKRLKQLEALEKLGAQHNVTLHQALAQQTALRPQVTVEELKRIISSPKPEHNEA